MGPVAAPQLAAAPGTGTETAIGANVSQLKVVDFGFAPGNDLVPPGTTLTWTNTGAITHTVTSDDGLFDSGDLGAGQTFTTTLTDTGTYWYFCRPHPFMRGRIVVATTAPAVSDQGVQVPEEPTPAQER
jgi:plastocyanin